MADTDPATPETPAPTRNPLRKLYNWTLAWAAHPSATWALFLLAFAEASFFPVPPDVLLIALVLGRPEKAWWYALVCSAGSLLGGMAGYAIGWGFWEATSGFWFNYVFSEEAFNRVQGLYQEYDWLVVFMAAFTPIPYKVITIAAGVCKINFAAFLVASVIGRSARFFLVAGLLRLLGPKVKPFIDRWFNWLALLFAILLVLGFWILSKA